MSEIIVLSVPKIIDRSSTTLVFSLENQLAVDAICLKYSNIHSGSCDYNYLEIDKFAEFGLNYKCYQVDIDKKTGYVISLKENYSKFVEYFFVDHTKICYTLWTQSIKDELEFIEMNFKFIRASGLLEVGSNLCKYEFTTTPRIYSEFVTVT